MANQMATRTVRIACSALVLLTAVFAVSASAQTRRNGGYSGYGGSITVFTNPNFSGQSVSFRDDTPDLRGYSLNDKISSLEIQGGESWEVCQDINFGNRCQVFSGSVSDLRSMGWNDRISSLRRVGNGFRGRPSNSQNYNDGLVLYDRPNFQGNSRVITGNGNVGANSRSAQVRRGSWELCDRTGRCAIVNRDVSDLSQLGLNGRITSARMVNGNQNNGNNGWGRGRGYGRR